MLEPYFAQNNVTLYRGDNRLILPMLPAKSVHSVITSPPYWGLRDYGIAASVWGGEAGCRHEWGDTIIVQTSAAATGKTRWNHQQNGRGEVQPIGERAEWSRDEVPKGKFCQKCGAWAGALGLEPTPGLFVQHVVMVFAEVHRVLRDDGTLWLNLGDSYFSGGRGGDTGKSGLEWSTESQEQSKLAAKSFRRDRAAVQAVKHIVAVGSKPKDLVGIPWMCAFALRAAGWYLRQDIIWNKPNPMPESVTDRCTKAHEYLFLLTKSERYYFNADAIGEACTESSLERLSQDVDNQLGSDRVPGKTNGPMKAVGGHRKVNGGASFGKQKHNTEGTGAQSRQFDRPVYETRNKRSVWTVPTKSFKGAHFATFPTKLIEPCVKAGVPVGGVVLDPFFGAGTTGLVAQQQHVQCIGIEFNEAYCEIAAKRLAQGVLFGGGE